MSGRQGASLRLRVTAVATGAVVVVLVLAGVVLVGAQRRLLTESVDEAVEERAADLEALVAADDVPATITGLGDDDSVAQVVDPSGTVVASSANVEGRPPVADLGAGLRTVEGLPVGDAPYRLRSRSTEDGGAVLVGASLDDVEESTQVLTTSLAAALPAVVALLAGVVWWLVGRTLRPVEAMRAEVASIGGGDLHRRVPEPGGGDEVDRLARTMNAMLDRLEDAARRSQRFVADASHELRSPLARMRAELEVDLAHPSRADPAATARCVLAQTSGLQRLVDDLLHLARADAGAAEAGSAAVDLDDVVLRAARRLREDGRVAVDTSAVSAAQVRGDRGQLARAVANLADNAARHARSRVAFTLAERDGRAVLTVADDGPGIPAEAGERVFERFARLDEARGTATGGAGLGLAIARDIAVRHDGTLGLDGAGHEGRGARFVLDLPAAPLP